MTATIPQCGPDESPDAMHEMLDEAGCLVVRDLASAEQMAAVRTELSEYVEAADAGEDDPDAFYPGKTHRVVALAHRSSTVRELMMNPTVEALGDRHLLPNCKAAVPTSPTMRGATA